jgi:hypothetical protein
MLRITDRMMCPGITPTGTRLAPLDPLRRDLGRFGSRSTLLASSFTSPMGDPITYQRLRLSPGSLFQFQDRQLRRGRIRCRWQQLPKLSKTLAVGCSRRQRKLRYFSQALAGSESSRIRKRLRSARLSSCSLICRVLSIDSMISFAEPSLPLTLQGKCCPVVGIRPPLPFLHLQLRPPQCRCGRQTRLQHTFIELCH